MEGFMGEIGGGDYIGLDGKNRWRDSWKIDDGIHGRRG
jgi:hypothetical protein